MEPKFQFSVERLTSMKKYVFGLGSAQVLATAAMVGLVTHFLSGQPGPAASFIGNGLALSSTAVVLQIFILMVLKQQRYLRDGRCTYPPLLYPGREIESRFCEYVDAINKIEGSGSPGFWSATVDVKQVMKIGSVISQGPPPFKKACQRPNLPFRLWSCHPNHQARSRIFFFINHGCVLEQHVPWGC